jgi:hypothetical protein
MVVDPFIVQKVLSTYKTAHSIESLVRELNGSISRRKIYEIIKNDREDKSAILKKKYDSKSRFILNDQDLLKIKNFLKLKNSTPHQVSR